MENNDQDSNTGASHLSEEQSKTWDPLNDGADKNVDNSDHGDTEGSRGEDFENDSPGSSGNDDSDVSDMDVDESTGNAAMSS